MPLPRRFQVSKFKNTTPKNPKKEDCIYDLPIGSFSSGNNGIQSSSCLLAFHIDGEGGKLGVLPVSAAGRKHRTDLTVVCAHRDAVTDFGFFPFRTGLLATCSRDDKVKIWELSDQNGNIPSPTSVGEPNGSIDVGGRHLECLSVHPSADGILAACGESGALICDVEKETVALEVNTGLDERVQCASWQYDGRLLALGDKGRAVHLFDPRTGSEPIATTQTHAGLGREGRVAFLGETGRLLTSGFAKNRYREVFIYDVGNFTEPIHTKQFDSSTGLLMPLYDNDTKLVYLAGKGSNKVLLYELSAKNDELLEVSMYSGSDQSLGVCLLPKSALNVMEGEVDRLMQLTHNSICPVSCIVPRKTYRDFHAELFPDTVCGIPGCTGEEWLDGSNALPPKYSLDPAKRELLNDPNVRKNVSVTNGHADTNGLIDHCDNNLSNNQNGNDSTRFFTPNSSGLVGARLSAKSDTSDPISPDAFITPSEFTPKLSNRMDFHTPTALEQSERATFKGDTSPPAKGISGNNDERKTEEKNAQWTPRSIQDIKKQLGSTAGEAGEVFKKDDELKEKVPASSGGLGVPMRGNRAELTVGRSDKARSCVVGVRQSKFRHVNVTLGASKGSFTNLRNVNTRLSLESNGFCVSGKWGAVPLSGPGAVIAIFELSNPEKILDGVIPGLANLAAVTELCWCPFDQSQLAVGCDNGLLKIWRIPDQGVHSMMEEPEILIQAFSDKVTIVRYNPVVKNVLVTVSFDSVSLWDITSQETSNEPKIRLQGHGDSVLCVAWSSDGRRLATTAKDRILRIYEPAKSASPISEANVLDSTRGARMFFACADSLIATVSFSRSSDRQVSLYDSKSLDHLHTLPVDTSPQLLIPHYDYDSSVVFLTGKGDITVHMYEILTESPWLIALNRFVAPSAHQAISIQQKNVCDVRQVEFARGQRMTLNTVESMVFAVPRRKKDLFQNDLYPDSLVTWSSSISAHDYFSGKAFAPAFQSLKPDDMGLLYPELAGGGNQTPHKSKTTTDSRPQIVNGTPSVARNEPVNAKLFSKPQRHNAITVENPGSTEMKKDIMESMSVKMDTVGAEKILEQDMMEGVAEYEWH